MNRKLENNFFIENINIVRTILPYSLNYLLKKI